LLLEGTNEVKNEGGRKAGAETLFNRPVKVII